MSKEEAMKLALEALDRTDSEPGSRAFEREEEAITALREALAEPTSADYAMGYAEGFNDACNPAQQEPVTDEENERFSRDVSNFKGTDEAATMYALEIFLKNRKAEQPVQQEPVATLWQHGETGRTRITMPGDITDCDARWFKAADLFTSPPAQRTWVGLTDKEEVELWESTDSDWELMKRAEAKLKEKNR